MTAGDWRASWDRQQNAHEPDREHSFELMLDYVELLAGRPARLLDLACGTGSISERALARFPGAQVVALDVDPVMLELVAGALADDSRVQVVDRDLREPSWREGLGEFDAVLSATALHWLSEERLELVYRDVAGIVRPGGVFANRDHFPIEEQRLHDAGERALERHLEREVSTGAETYAQWYERLAGDEDFSALLAERTRRLPPGDGELWLPASWHRERLLTAGFAAADVTWRWGNDALLVAVR